MLIKKTNRSSIVYCSETLSFFSKHQPPALKADSCSLGRYALATVTKSWLKKTTVFWIQHWMLKTLGMNAWKRRGRTCRKAMTRAATITHWMFFLSSSTTASWQPCGHGTESSGFGHRTPACLLWFTANSDVWPTLRCSCRLAATDHAPQMSTSGRHTHPQIFDFCSSEARTKRRCQSGCFASGTFV